MLSLTDKQIAIILSPIGFKYSPTYVKCHPVVCISIINHEPEHLFLCGHLHFLVPRTTGQRICLQKVSTAILETELKKTLRCVVLIYDV